MVIIDLTKYVPRDVIFGINTYGIRNNRSLEKVMFAFPEIFNNGTPQNNIE